MNNPRIQQRLDRAKARLDKLNRVIHGDRAMADAFHGGRVGFLSGPAARRKARSLERTIDAATQAVRLEQHIRHLEALLARPERPAKPTPRHRPVTSLAAIRVPPADELRLYDAGFLTKEAYFQHVLGGGQRVAGLDRLNARLDEYRSFTS